MTREAGARPQMSAPPPKAPARAHSGTASGTTLLEARNVPVAGTPAGLVFLDFDNTIIDGDAGPLFGMYLFRWRRHEAEGHPWTRFKIWARYVPFFTWMGVQGAFYAVGAVRRSTIVRAAYRGLKGIKVDDFVGLLDQFTQEILIPRIHPEVRREIEAHHAAGRRCMVITTGMETLVRPVLDHLGPGIGLIGCRLHAKDGRLTGRVEGPLFGQDKANILHAYCRAVDVPVAACYAYSDHFSDIHMMQAVGHGVAVNPRGKLRRRAAKHGWRVLDTVQAVG